MIRSHRTREVPSGVSTVSHPGSTAAGDVEDRIVIRPAAAAAASALAFASLARAKSADRLRRVTILPCAGSAISPRAFSMPASPPPTTTMCSSMYSVGSSSWYWMCGRCPPSQRIRLGLPWVPIARTTVAASRISPLVSSTMKAPLAPETLLASAPYRTLTPAAATCSSQVVRIVSRKPGVNEQSARRTSCEGVAITCLPR